MKIIFWDNNIGVRKLNCDESYPVVLEKISQNKTVLDWHINTIGGTSNQYYYIGRYHIEKLLNKYNYFDFYYAKNNEESLKVLNDILDSGTDDYLIINPNIIYKNVYIDKFFKSRNKISIGISKECIDLAFQDIKFDKGYFNGIIYIPKSNLDIVRESIRKYVRINKNNCLFGWIRDNGCDYNYGEINKDFINIKYKEQIFKFFMGTKAQTLQSLSKIVTKSTILDQISFTVEEYMLDKEAIYIKINEKYKNKYIVVRSSSLSEDSFQESNAGKFESYLNIDVNNKSQVYITIEKVIKSYGEKDFNNEVLIQEYICNSIMSGVLFTRNIDDLSPYYIINYDDKSGLTDTVTSGNGVHIKNKIVVRSNGKVADEKINKLLEAAKEIEDILEYDAIDIEFILTDSELYIVQVRPITTYKKEATMTDDDVFNEIKCMKKYINNLISEKSYIEGKTTILGNMPDWNPAELIGYQPRPLALSLYQKLITNGIWSIAREEIGYKSLGYSQLVYSISGKPYVDVRKSFNSFLPRGLKRQTEEKIINYQINKLKNNKHLHDKIEFYITKSIYDLNYKKFEKELKDNWFSEEEIVEFKSLLNNLTNNIFNNINESLKVQHERIRLLNVHRNELIKNYKNSNEEIPFLINSLVNDCIINGILPFSILARYAFISMSFLKSLVDNFILTVDEYNNILRSISTVATEFTSDSTLLMLDKISKSEFLSKYGHLRPNTYDINSLNYKDGYNIYFNSIGRQICDIDKEDYIDDIFEEKKNEINEQLKANKLNFNYNDLKEFIKLTIPAREWAKFEFTKNINLILELVCEFGEKFNLSRDDMSYISIDKIISLAFESHSSSIGKEINRDIEYRKKKYLLWKLIKTPTLICNERDIEEFFIEKGEANFITNKSIVEDIVTINSNNIEIEKIKGKIVIIECADPGFDWIFGYEIKGLITKYGGAASHMAIRCAEFGIPAAIGVGEMLFSSLLKVETIQLDCENNKIRIIK